MQTAPNFKNVCSKFLLPPGLEPGGNFPIETVKDLMVKSPGWLTVVYFTHDISQG